MKRHVSLLVTGVSASKNTWLGRDTMIFARQKGQNGPSPRLVHQNDVDASSMTRSPYNGDNLYRSTASFLA